MKCLGALLCVVALLSSTSFTKDEGSVSEFVKKHLDSVGTEPVRAALKTRVAEGVLQFHMLHQGGSQDGKMVLVSEGNKVVCLLKLPNPNYHGERFVSDGHKTEEAQVKPGAWSELGAFVRAHNEILTEGLWGGTLSAGWPLLDSLESRHAKLQSTGRKKVDGREMLQFRYSPAKRSDLEISLYFEPETGRHVLTTYGLTVAPQMALTELETAKQKSTTYLLEERFSDFKEQDHLTLPSRWEVRFTLDVPPDPSHPGSAAVYARSDTWTFDVSVKSVSNNVTLDPKNFDMK